MLPRESVCQQVSLSFGVFDSEVELLYVSLPARELLRGLSLSEEGEKRLVIRKNSELVVSELRLEKFQRVNNSK
jgi:hypothetical protein